MDKRVLDDLVDAISEAKSAGYMTDEIIEEFYNENPKPRLYSIYQSIKHAFGFHSYVEGMVISGNYGFHTIVCEWCGDHD